MVFKCQEDSFLREYTSKVLKCEKTNESIVEYGKVSKFDGYQITLENTILFPAGGGQPHDKGWLNDTEVLQVLRKGDEALHFTLEPITEGSEVVQKIDWQRRFDHMQQHTGQHLLSAILEKEHNLPTTSWWLGAEECFVELDSTTIKYENIKTAEERCNKLISDGISVNVKFFKANDPALNEAHTRGLPKDCIDTIRVICIGDVDENMCCGTHVTNLCQLQMIKLLGTEPGKKGKTNLRFIVGNRVVKTFQKMLDREKALTGLLKNEPSKHEELVSKMQKNMKLSNKNLQNVLAELAQCQIDNIKNSNPKPKYFCLFKRESTPEFNRIICKGLESDDIFILLASEDPDKTKEGQIILQGPEVHCNALGQQIMDTLKGKGAFKNGKFQGKAGDVSNFNKCTKIIEEYFNNV
ncbi:putative Alanyl-tRNA synthetase domain containing 1 [Danaus plexippus plexippus]|uniref:Alanyl-tRNA synthetase domain containing 1 n=1 Tax=Danaus plexippus plexippus TaxID=278856 RepID=A0A212FK38_DANPL|nr:putative Alanyl-tRNA synthetase domain containing 1 [Danaus plexippus plexippus]